MYVCDEKYEYVVTTRPFSTTRPALGETIAIDKKTPAVSVCFAFRAVDYNVIVDHIAVWRPCVSPPVGFRYLLCFPTVSRGNDDCDHENIPTVSVCFSSRSLMYNVMDRMAVWRSCAVPLAGFCWPLWNALCILLWYSGAWAGIGVPKDARWNGGIGARAVDVRSLAQEEETTLTSPNQPYILAKKEETQPAKIIAYTGMTGWYSCTLMCVCISVFFFLSNTLCQ